MTASRRKRSDIADTLRQLRSRLKREKSGRQTADAMVTRLEGRIAFLEHELERLGGVVSALSMTVPRFNKPLTMVMGYSELLARKVEEPLERSVRIIVTETERLARLVRRMRRIARASQDA